LHECQKAQSEIYALFATGLQFEYGRLKSPISRLSWLRPVIAVLYLFIAAAMFKAAVDQGLTLIYAFNHDEAVRSFKKALELDPNAALALAFQGAAEEGIPHIRQGLETWHRMGGELGLPRILAMLAEAYSVAGALTSGRDVLADALMIADRNAECRTPKLVMVSLFPSPLSGILTVRTQFITKSLKMKPHSVLMVNFSGQVSMVVVEFDCKFGQLHGKINLTNMKKIYVLILVIFTAGSALAQATWSLDKGHSKIRCCIVSSLSQKEQHLLPFNCV
jgi:tetratricopeptide (TPR) repeat protein